MTSRKILVETTKGQLVPKSMILKKAENHLGANFRTWGQNSNACNLYIVGKEILLE